MPTTRKTNPNVKTITSSSKIINLKIHDYFVRAGNAKGIIDLLNEAIKNIC